MVSFLGECLENSSHEGNERRGVSGRTNARSRVALGPPSSILMANLLTTATFLCSYYFKIKQYQKERYELG